MNLPHSSQNKYSAYLLNNADGQGGRIYIKGAPEVIRNMCANYFDAHGQTVAADADVIGRY